MNILWYEPGEDSYTLVDALKGEDFSNKVILDLGSSTGYIADSITTSTVIIRSDLNIKALQEQNKKKPLNLIRADLLTPYTQSKIDIVIFNPPYVLDSSDPILGGGEYGRVIIDRFINTVEIKTVYLLVIEANKPKEVVENMKKRGYEVSVLKKRRILRETIYILKGDCESAL